MSTRKNTAYLALAIILIAFALAFHFRYNFMLGIQHGFVMKNHTLQLSHGVMLQVPANWLLESYNLQNARQIYPLDSLDNKPSVQEPKLAGFVFGDVVDNRIQDRIWVSELSNEDVQKIRSQIAFGKTALKPEWKIISWKGRDALLDNTNGFWLFVPDISVAIRADTLDQAGRLEFAVQGNTMK